ncbi:MAG: 2-succinyl-5-enolpyruvyl-6-hydroxy-3-cyclohexene-1-carboxylic-acid synthase [Bacteroidales bacterium]|jgi:2-succinyl-5-enolpyruvyl-6-hydroxy-3-cyclohexene-1-carboxylate synthase|nr:2-succinyl-5-enolpyruvyl-6-hydroxy-3-cyclohexene-1-carboxylic-acid synthase [Bacteroidales bacterium]
MYSNKKNVLQLAALLQAFGVRHIVLSSGARNAPLAHTFAAHPFFICHSVIDERSAAFYALGVMDSTRETVAICCTSGTAVLNYASAVAEAFYRQLPLVVITADRPEALLGQMDNQVIPQRGLFGALVRKFVQLPEITTPDDEWYCNRLINEALLEKDHHGKGPVHINVPLSEPLFEYSEAALPAVRKINRHTEANSCAKRFPTFAKRMIIAGQLPPDNGLKETLEILAEKYNCVVLAEHPSNLHSPSFAWNFDALLGALTDDEQTQYAPDLLISVGGHVVSKRVKQFFKKHPPQEHWLVSATGDVADLYHHLTNVIETEALSFLEALVRTDADAVAQDALFPTLWKRRLDAIPVTQPEYSDLSAVKALMQALPDDCSLHLANSSSVRFAQLFPLKATVHTFSNRGTSGIDGCLSTAVGYAAVSDRLTFLLTGDLAFFYDMNGLWNRQITGNLRILLNNNGGGEIFCTLPKFDHACPTEQYTMARHSATAQAWAEAAGFTYLQASNKAELQHQIPILTDATSDKPILLEVLTEMEKNCKILL